jgi:hypothetical protein
VNETVNERRIVWSSRRNGLVQSVKNRHSARVEIKNGGNVNCINSHLHVVHSTEIKRIEVKRIW